VRRQSPFREEPSDASVIFYFFFAGRERTAAIPSGLLARRPRQSTLDLLFFLGFLGFSIAFLLTFGHPRSPLGLFLGLAAQNLN